MNRLKWTMFVTALAACLTAVAPAARQGQGAQKVKNGEKAVAITNVRVFDGERVIHHGTVVITGRTISYAGENDQHKIPDGAEIIDGTGATLMPGLIDSHVHDWGYGAERAPIFGVTTELEMFGDPAIAQIIRDQEAIDGAPYWVSLITAGTLATVPGGHGTEYGLEIPTLTTPGEAQQWVDDRIAEGSDFIKIVLEDGSPFGYKTPIPTFDRATFRALVKAAHKRHKLAVAHVTEESYAIMAIEENIDGLVHAPSDVTSVEFAQFAAARNVFVVPTLTVLEAAAGIASGASLTTDPRIAPFLFDWEIENLLAHFPNKGNLTLDAPMATVANLKAANVPILAGSDVFNPGTGYGMSVHRELELLVQAGLTPRQALRAATSAPADAFRLKDRGRIEKGLRADLVLVNGNPLKDITATRDILRVWKLGSEVVRTPVALLQP